MDVEVDVESCRWKTRFCCCGLDDLVSHRQNGTSMDESITAPMMSLFTLATNTKFAQPTLRVP